MLCNWNSAFVRLFNHYTKELNPVKGLTEEHKETRSTEPKSPELTQVSQQYLQNKQKITGALGDSQHVKYLQGLYLSQLINTKMITRELSKGCLTLTMTKHVYAFLWLRGFLSSNVIQSLIRMYISQQNNLVRLQRSNCFDVSICILWLVRLQPKKNAKLRDDRLSPGSEKRSQINLRRSKLWAAQMALKRASTVSRNDTSSWGGTKLRQTGPWCKEGRI